MRIISNAGKSTPLCPQVKVQVTERDRKVNWQEVIKSLAECAYWKTSLRINKLHTFVLGNRRTRVWALLTIWEKDFVMGPTHEYTYSLEAHWVSELRLWKKANGQKNHLPAIWELLKNETSEKAGFFSTSSREIRFDCHLNWGHMKKVTSKDVKWK